MSDTDPRVTCMDCQRNRGMTCTDAVRAGLAAKSRDIPIGRDFATLPQHCPAHVVRPEPQPRRSQ